MMKKIVTLILTIAALSAACRQKPPVGTANLDFSVEIPQHFVGDEAERAQYTALHYWDKFNFADTTLFGMPAFDDALAAYCQRLWLVPPRQVAEALERMIGLGEGHPAMMRYMNDFFRRTFDTPGSRFFSERIYSIYIEVLLGSATPDNSERKELEMKLELLRRNAIGTPAEDFVYTLSSGETVNMYDIEADYVLLLFGYRDDDAYRMVQVQIAHSLQTRQLLESGRMKVLQVYTGTDMADWVRSSEHDFPGWIYGWDNEGGIAARGLYDLKGVPDIYLLDRNKKVLLKHTRPSALFRALPEPE